MSSPAWREGLVGEGVQTPSSQVGRHKCQEKRRGIWPELWGTRRLGKLRGRLMGLRNMCPRSIKSPKVEWQESIRL